MGLIITNGIPISGKVVSVFLYDLRGIVPKVPKSSPRGFNQNVGGNHLRNGGKYCWIVSVNERVQEIIERDVFKPNLKEKNR